MSTMAMVLTCVQSNHQMHQSTRWSMYIIMMIHHLQILSRKKLAQLLTRFYQFGFLKPILHTIPLIDVLLPPWLYLTPSWLLYAAAPGVGHNGSRGYGGRYGHWGTYWLTLASCNPTKLDFLDWQHIVDRPDWKCMTNNIAAPIWDQMTATEVHISTPWCSLHYALILLVGNKNHGAIFGV